MKLTKHFLFILGACLLMYSCDLNSGNANAGNSNAGNSGSDDSTEQTALYNINFDYAAAKSGYGEFSITGKDENATFEQTEGVITITSTAEKTEFTLTGHFVGQIINNTKNTVLNLSGAYLENTEGKPVIVSTKKLEISAKEGTPSYIVSTGTAAIEKSGTVYCADAEGKSKNLEIGGKGTCYVVGVLHGLKADEVKAKGSGTWYVVGTKNKSAINCNTFLTKDDATVTLVLGNAENGIKADESITISSGTLWFENVTTAMKTDTKEEDDPTKTYFITLANCKIYKKTVKNLYETETDAYTETNVVIE